MKVINIIGEPSCGKSTTSAMLFALMKQKGFNVELVTEFAKELLYDENITAFKNQDYIFAEQRRRITRLEGKVDYVITDSPLLLHLHYINQNNTPRSLIPFMLDCIEEHENIYFLLDRKHNYEDRGRFQNEEEAKKIRDSIKYILYKHNIDFYDLTTDNDLVDKIHTLAMLDKGK